MRSSADRLNALRGRAAERIGGEPHRIGLARSGVPPLAAYLTLGLGVALLINANDLGAASTVRGVGVGLMLLSVTALLGARTFLIVEREGDALAYELDPLRGSELRRERWRGAFDEVEVDPGGRWIRIAGRRLWRAPGFPPLSFLDPRRPVELMTGSASPVRIRVLQVAAAAIVLLGAVSIAEGLVETEAEEVNSVIAEWNRAIGEEDGEKLCALLTPRGQRRLIETAVAQGLTVDARVRCPEAGALLGSAISPAVRDAYLDDHVAREVTIDGATAVARLSVAGFSETLELVDQGGEWMLKTATPETEIDASYLPASRGELKAFLAGVCQKRSIDVVEATIEESKDRASTFASATNAILTAASNAERRLVDQLERLARTEAANGLLEEPLRVAMRRQLALERAVARSASARNPRELRRRLSFMAPLNRSYDAAFEAAGLDLCITAQSLQPRR